VPLNLSPLLAETYEPGMNPTGWWLSEKLDGIRCCWDHTCRTFRSRNGNAFAVPKAFVAKLPDLPLDGELWISRGQFDRTSSVVRSAGDKGWVDVTFMLFDIPMREAGPFEERYEVLQHLAKLGLGSQVKVLTQTKCTGLAMLEQTMDYIVENGGEGLMLRKPGSLYEHRRSSTLLKYKRMLDAEAVVVGYQPGEGRHTGSMGALHCVLPSGKNFKVGTGFSDAERANPPPIGCTISFKYQELTKSGTPRFPAFVRIRNPE